MSTPHSQSGFVPSPTSKKTVAHNSISTPSQHGYPSPIPPRSVPSPAATRKDQAGKTPINHPTTGSSQGSKTIAGGTPMMPNLSQQGSTASPLPGIPSGATPNGLGVDLGTPSHLNVSTPALAAGMVPTMSELGLTISGGSIKRNEDEERRKKMRRILHTIGESKGRISEEGIARVSRRVGFANDIDAEKLSNEERERRVGNRTFSIAGITIVIDVELKEHIPQSVQVHFSNTLAAAAPEQAERAGRILLDDLAMSNRQAINTSLNRFASNLERLAKLDHLSSSRISCFDALSGIYSSLKRLYDQEFKLANDLFKDEDEQRRLDKSRRYVEMRKSGIPLMHETGTLGLSIHYWRNRQLVRNSDSDIANHKMKQRSISPPVDKGQCRIQLNVGRSQSSLYPPIRVSTIWLPEDLSLDENTAQIPWQEPEITYLADIDDIAGETSKTLPDLRFVAEFTPPIVLPWQTAAAICGSVGANVTPAFQAPSYLSLLLGLTPSSKLPHVHATTRNVLAHRDDELMPVKHDLSVSISKHELGFRLEQLPFSHPRHVIELIPTLRQWQCFSNLLASCFPVQGRGEKNTAADGSKPTLALLLSNGDVPDGTVSVEMALALTPVPTIGVTFPLKNGNLYSCDIQVLLNAEISVAGGSPAINQASEALSTCQDLSVWIEWIRARLR